MGRNYLYCTGTKGDEYLRSFYIQLLQPYPTCFAFCFSFCFAYRNRLPVFVARYVKILRLPH